MSLLENGDAAAIRAMWGSGFETKLQRTGSLARPEFDQVNTVGDRNCLKDTDDDPYWLKSGSTASEDSAFQMPRVVVRPILDIALS